VSSFGQWVTQVRTSGQGPGRREEEDIVARTVSAIRKFIFAVAFKRRGNSLFFFENLCSIMGMVTDLQRSSWAAATRGNLVFSPDLRFIANALPKVQPSCIEAEKMENRWGIHFFLFCDWGPKRCPCSQKIGGGPINVTPSLKR